MKNLNKDDLYEIEKIMDIYAGMVNEGLNRFCQTAINLDVTIGKKYSNAGVMDNTIKGLHKTQKRIKELRDKLETMRKE